MAALLVLALLAAACSSKSKNNNGTTTSTKPITIGTSVSLSGDFSADGVATKQGYLTWQDFVNSHGGIMGRKVKMIILSDGSSPTQVVTNYQKLITVNKVDFVLGPYSTFLTKPSSVIANRYGYVMVEGIGGGPSVFSRGLHNVFDVSASATFQMITFAKWLIATQSPQPVAYAVLDDPFIKPEVDGAKSLLESHGFTTAVYKVYPLETTDYTPIASAINSTHANIAVIGSMPTDGEAFIQTFVQQRYNPKMLIEASGPDQGAQFVKSVGARNTEGIMVPNTWYPGSKFFQNSEMVALYLKKFGGSEASVSADVAEAFAAGQVLAQAVNQIKTLDNKKLQDYLHSDVTFNSVQGPVRFGADGQNIAATPYVFQWQKGKLVAVLPQGPDTVPIEATRPNWGSTS